MKKISTLFKKDPDNLGMVINEIDPKNEWIFDTFDDDREVLPTRQYDGSASAIIDGKLYKRYANKVVENNGRYIETLDMEKFKDAIMCERKWVGVGSVLYWIPCLRENNADKYHFEAFDKMEFLEDGTYELVGKKVNGNNEQIEGHILIKHGVNVLPIEDFSFEGLQTYLGNGANDIEGIVFHHPDGRMCKIRKSDFGFKRHPKVFIENI